MIELPQAERCGRMQADALCKLLKQQPLNSAKPFLHEQPTEVPSPQHGVSVTGTWVLERTDCPANDRGPAGKRGPQRL